MGSDESHFKWWTKSQDSVQKPQPFWRERRAEAVSNRGPSAYQPNALSLGQTGWHCRGNTKSGFVCIIGPAQSGSQAPIGLTSSAEANEVRGTVVESCPVNTKQRRLCALHDRISVRFCMARDRSGCSPVISVGSVSNEQATVPFFIFVLFLCLSFYSLSVSSSLSLFEATLCDRFLRYIIFV